MVPAPIRYTFTWEDYVSLDKAVRQDNFWKRNQLVLVPLFLMTCVLVGLVAVPLAKGRPVYPILAEAFSSVYFWIALPAFLLVILGANRIERGLWYKRQRIDGVEITAAFDDADCLTLESRDGTSKVRWNAIRKVTTDETAHILLQENRMVGIALPKRAFTSDADFAAARAYIESKIASTRNTTT
jgi:hypothetical protein